MSVTDPVVDATQAAAAAGAVSTLVVDDLRPADLPQVAWSGGPSHLDHIAEALGRVGSGEVAYLAVRAETGEPVAIGGINFAKHEGAGTIWQLVTHPSLRSLGLGTRLITEAERRIQSRGCHWALLAVEDTNTRARALYERLGFQPHGRETSSWIQDDGDGTPYVHEAECTVLRKAL